MAVVLKQTTTLGKLEEKIKRKKERIQKRKKEVEDKLKEIGKEDEPEDPVSGKVQSSSFKLKIKKIYLKVSLFFLLNREKRVKKEAKKRDAELRGNAGEQAVISYIEKNFGEDAYLINDITVYNGWKKAQIDHVLICPQGIFCIETKNYSTAYFYANDEEWGFYRNGRPLYVNSPQQQSLYHVEVLRGALRKRRLRIIPLVILSHRNGYFDGNDDYCKVLKLYQFRDFVDKHSEVFSEREREKWAKKVLKLGSRKPPRKRRR